MYTHIGLLYPAWHNHHLITGPLIRFANPESHLAKHVQPCVATDRQEWIIRTSRKPNAGMQFAIFDTPNEGKQNIQTNTPVAMVGI